MKSIDADIKNGRINNIYLLMGVEPYLIRQYRDKLVRTLINEDDQINYRYYNSENLNIHEIIEFADTVPFFAPRRVIVLENTGLFKTEDKGLADYLSGMPQTTYMIFTECYARQKPAERIDEKKYEKNLVRENNKLYKQVVKNGHVAKFERQSDRVITAWIVKRVKDSGLEITRRALDCLFEYAGNDMSTLNSEVEKLICYRLGRKSIDIDDVKQICTRSIDNEIFEMIRAMTARDKRKVFKLYYDMLLLEVRPGDIRWNMSAEFEKLFKIKTYDVEGKSTEEIVKAMHLPGFVVKNYISVAGRMTFDYIKKALDDFAETDYLIKSGMLEETVGLEMLIVKYTSRDNLIQF